LKDSRAVVPLCQALEDGNLFVVRAAADALAQVGDVQAIGPLLKALSDGRSEVRRRIIKALESFGPIVETLTAGLDRGSSRAKMGIAEALAELGGQKATEALFQALEDSDREVRVSIARALVYLGEGDVRRRLEAIVEEQGPGADEVREELKRSLKK
jgi:HEAT repeat protein